MNGWPVEELRSRAGAATMDFRRQAINEFPKQPLPHVPLAPPEPQRPHVQPPTVVVYEKARWEYKIVSSTPDDPGAVEAALNTLGREGWEGIGIVPLSNAVHVYLKRPLSGSR